MDSSIEEVKKRLEIVEYIGTFVNLKKAGRNFKGNCPFHKEKTPSFVVSPDRQIWHCFGSCQDGGDVIKFLMKRENITFFEALKELAEKTGVKLQTFAIEDKTFHLKERLISLNSVASEYYEYVLNKSPFGKTAISYLESRQITKKISETFQIGYAPASWDSLTKFLQKKKFADPEIEASGLAIRGNRNSLYDRFRGRLMFPIKDTRGVIIGFSGRLLHDQDKAAKYVNTPETPLYRKRESLYGITLAKESIKKENNVFLVEGEFDVITPFQAGISNIVAVKGTAITQEQLQLLKRYTTKITFTMDADMAGLEAMKKGINEAEELEFEIGVVKIDFAKDPDEAIRTNPAKFKELTQNPIPIYDFILQVAQTKYPVHDPFGKKKIADEVAPYLDRIKNPIVRSHYLKKLASYLDVDLPSIESLLFRLRQKTNVRHSFTNNSAPADKPKREDLIEKYLLSIVFQQEKTDEHAGIIFACLSPTDFAIPSHQHLSQIYLTFKEKNPAAFVMSEFVKVLDSAHRAVFDEIYLFASSEIPFEKDNIRKLALEAKRYALKRQLATLANDEKPDAEKLLQVVHKKLNEVEKTMAAM